MKKPGQFFDMGDGITKGKGISALDLSRASKNDLIKHFGGSWLVPSSVMLVKRSTVTMRKAVRDEVGRQRSYKSSDLEHRDPEAHKKLVARATKSRLKHMGKSGLSDMLAISGKGAAAGALSIFWQDIGRSLLLLYTNPGDVVVDPFAGHNSRMELCVKVGRHYLGQDLSVEFMKYNVKRALELRKEFSEVEIKLRSGDSRKLEYSDACGDFMITSPPYWDIEEYGPEPEQMSETKTYREFMDAMQLVMDESFRVLKRGAIAAWFVNDFRRKGKFYPYHYDTMTLALNSGFRMRDMLIVDLGRGFRDVFLNQTVETRILPKRHEYGVIFEKP